MYTNYQTQIPTELDEIQQIYQAKAGNKTAFARLVEAHRKYIYKICYQILGCTHETEDAVQKVLIRAYLKLETFDETRNFRTWLAAIARHYCLDQCKRSQPSTVSWDSVITSHYQPKMSRAELY